MIAAHQHWPALAGYAQQLQQQWPDALSGCQRLLFNQGQVTLDLWLGDINQLTETFDDSMNGQVDAWFLDGFAPSKNPEMWNDRLFQAMARLSRQEGTFATFTAAGFVRRGLQQAGFEVERRKGFGHKREMLCGTLPRAVTSPPPRPWFSRKASASQDIAIIGGGIASACLSLALLRRGYQVSLYCADACPAQNASGNRQGALYPLLNSHDPALARFFRRHSALPGDSMMPSPAPMNINGAACCSLAGMKKSAQNPANAGNGFARDHCHRRRC